MIEEIMETGVALYVRQAAQHWYEDACDELASAEILLDHDGYKGAYYHAQQCVEKGLQALILERGRRPARVHDLLLLKNEVEQLGFHLSLTIDDAIFLNSVYKGRYPTEAGLLPHGQPSREEASRAVTAARDALPSVNTALNPI